MKFFLTKLKTSRSGFSLIELMVVIAIIGLLSGIALPNFIGKRNDRMLKGAARDLLSDIQAIRMKSITNNERWSIKFNTNNYQIKDANGNVKKTVTFNDKKNGVSYGSGAATNPIGGTFDVDFITYPPLGAGVGNTLTYNPRGTCNAGYVYLTNTKGTVYGIGTLSSGIVIFKQWVGTSWSD